MYVLALYERNRQLMPKIVNYFMELEYGLITQALELIRKIGEDFAVNNKQGNPKWLYYKKTPQYKELELLLQKDYSLLSL